MFVAVSAPHRLSGFRVGRCFYRSSHCSSPSGVGSECGRPLVHCPPASLCRTLFNQGHEMPKRRTGSSVLQMRVSRNTNLRNADETFPSGRSSNARQLAQAGLPQRRTRATQRATPDRAAPRGSGRRGRGSRRRSARWPGRRCRGSASAKSSCRPPRSP